MLIGVRENERAAQAFGVSAVRAKLTAFAVSGFIAAFAGALFVHHQQGLGIQAYGVERSLQVFIMVVIGGLGSLPGAILGAVFIQGVEYFRNVFPESIRTSSGSSPAARPDRRADDAPGGLAQACTSCATGCLRFVADRRDILVPSLVADRRARRAARGRAFEEAEAHAAETNGATPKTKPVNAESQGESAKRRPRHDRALARTDHRRSAAVPLAVLFGLNAVDELDRSAFEILIPEIRDDFGLDTKGSSPSSRSSRSRSSSCEIPIAFYADRLSRVRIAVAGAVVWGCFTLLTGLAPAIAVLALVARAAPASGAR